MQRLEELKQELIKQKEIITKKGGKVAVLNTNPSPSEITAGINSIVSADIDFSLANATAEDVKKGKTYYNNLGELQTGNYEDIGYTYFLYNKSQMDGQAEYELTLPNYMTEVRDCLFYNFPSKLHVRLDPKTTIVNNQAFYSDSGEITIENFNELTALTAVEDYGFANAKGIDLSNLPATLNKFGNYAFKDTFYGQTTLNIPMKISTFGTGCFSASDNRKPTLKSVDISGLSGISERMFGNVFFDFDFILPESVLVLGTYSFYNGGVKSIVFHEKVNVIGNYSFYSIEDKIFTEYMVFLKETPPTIGSSMINSRHRTQFVIYVPDNSVDAYQKKLSGCNVKPMSEKP